MAWQPSSRRRLLIGGAAVLDAALIGTGGALRALSPGEPPRLVDEAGHRIAGSLSERVFVPINGIRQGIIIQGRDPSNPVLLFLHGGPGMPEFFLNTTHPTGLENDFTVVWWEQRGAGLSFSADIPPQSMTVAQMIADTVAVADYLRDRFQQDKIYLLGHSWGSFLGIQVAAAAPERFHAYVGMGQVSYQLQSEVAANAFLLEQYRALGDTAMVRRLEAAPVSRADGLSDAWLRVRDDAMHRLGVGTTRDMRSVISGVFIPVWRCRAYTICEKIAIWRGMAWSRRFLWDEFIATDLTTRIHRLDLPVYFFTGAHDLTANHDLSRMYFDQIDAPVKGFYTFDASAHSPLFEEPLRAREILRQDVLFNRVRLADGPAGD
ncbi:alpha/beta hydrolase [Rhodovulum steppense]|uniref:Pimeloyl-ACP methyl ester carboxylesterase n=1 Tax=Rhodovulum steppense TaxID=540251 RepID=A0A4R1YLM8_9RHOB|nr:alpha/beta hydrolase [Rhodovulum steppense]TCM78085.1 pimeloyl-ACP methyl ester carboxylesterase [Rhodovulum steppense]